jgi:3-deoxy-manno-octulosonate cytidylyltransferase (CMP-KDO synthetase)
MAAKCHPGNVLERFRHLLMRNSFNRRKSLRVTGIIPARWHSTRLEGKVLAEINGKPMVQHVYELCCQARLLSSTLIATDDVRVEAAARGFGAPVVLTSSDHQSGTDRVAEAARSLDCDVVVNIQGDEPMLNPVMINEVVAPLEKFPEVEFSTLKQRIINEDELNNPAVVKVVVDVDHYALYFSRSLIPYPTPGNSIETFEHIGIYAYRSTCLAKLAQLRPTPLEKSEGLEQLRALENGIRLYVVESGCRVKGISVDTPDDLEEVRQLMKGD